MVSASPIDDGRDDLYGGRDPRDAPFYSFVEAARAVDIPASTLRSWVEGREYRVAEKDRAFSEPVIQRPDPDDHRLSFTNLVEAHVLRSLRTQHGVSLGAVREALDVAQREFDIQRLLVSPALRTSAGKLFLDTYESLLTLSRSGQIALKKLLDRYLTRIDFEDQDLPVKFFPFPRGRALTRDDRVILLSPFVSFGHPVVTGAGVSTSAIVNRVDAGESVRAVAADYGIEASQVEDAILYERAA